MGHTRTSRAFAGTITSFLQYGILMVLQLALAPVVLRVAGQEVLGAYSFLMQIVSWAALTDLGFGVAVGRNLAQAHGIGDVRKRFRDVFATGRTFSIGSNLVFSALVFTAALNINRLIYMSPAVEGQAQLSLYLLSAWITIRVPGVLFGEALIATQNMAAVNIIVGVGNALRLVLSLVFIANGGGLVGLIAANIVAEATILIAQRYWYQKTFPEDRFGWGIPDHTLFRQMFAFGTTYMLMIVAGRLSSSTDSVIIGYLFGAAAVSVYYTSQIPATVLYQLVWKFTDNSAPALNELYAKRAYQNIAEIYLRLLRYSMLFVIPLAIGVVGFNATAITVWVGQAQYAGTLFTVALAVFSFTQVVIHTDAIVMVAYGNVRALGIFSLFAGIVKVILAFSLGRKIGLAGVMIANALVDLAGLVYFNLNVRRVLGLSIGRILHDSATPAVRASFPAVLVLLIIVAMQPTATWPSLLFWCTLYAIAWAAGAWIMGLQSTERDQVTGYVKSGLRLAFSKSGGM